ncbi:MAG: methyltransferase [Pseudomonadota bacterium]
MRLGAVGVMLAGALALAGCTSEEDRGDGPSTDASRSDSAFDEVLAADVRAKDRARDQYRNPAETLAFFQVAPDHTVIEYAPGGGWYTRILAPFVAENGRYRAVGFAPGSASSLGEDVVERVRERGRTFSARLSKMLELPADKLPYLASSELPEDVVGTVDRVLIFRTMHNLKRFGIAEAEIKSMFDALKPGGMLGVVQHRAKDDAPSSYVDGNKGYLKQSELTQLIESTGFELVEASEINANPRDTADYPGGVWTLPPSFAKGDEDREKYAEIGESDRMTLLFKKPE